MGIEQVKRSAFGTKGGQAEPVSGVLELKATWRIIAPTTELRIAHQVDEYED